MTTYGELHAGDTVLGADDGMVWGVRAVDRRGPLAITLVRDEGRMVVTGQPDPGAGVARVGEADVTAEREVAQHFIDAGFVVEIVSEQWDG